jgi:hypothetical protein
MSDLRLQAPVQASPVKPRAGAQPLRADAALFSSARLALDRAGAAEESDGRADPIASQRAATAGVKAGLGCDEHDCRQWPAEAESKQPSESGDSPGMLSQVSINAAQAFLPVSLREGGVLSAGSGQPNAIPLRPDVSAAGKTGHWRSPSRIDADGEANAVTTGFTLLATDNPRGIGRMFSPQADVSATSKAQAVQRPAAMQLAGMPLVASGFNIMTAELPPMPTMPRLAAGGDAASVATHSNPAAQFVVRAIETLPGDGGKAGVVRRIVLQIEPETLGRLHLQLEVAADGVTCAVTTETAEAAAALLADDGSLARAVAELGGSPVANVIMVNGRPLDPSGAAVTLQAPNGGFELRAGQNDTHGRREPRGGDHHLPGPGAGGQTVPSNAGVNSATLAAITI